MSDNYKMCFETLSNELRLSILKELQNESLTVNVLAKKIGAERSNVSHGLQMLKACGHVNVKKNGRENFYSINENSVFLSLPKNAQNMFDIIKIHTEENCNGCCKKSKLTAKS